MTRARILRSGAGGFTLLEVMIALAILATGLTWILRSTMNNVRNAEDSRYDDVVTHLARAKMLDVEEELRKEGFKETDQSMRGDFADEGWPRIRWEAEVRKVELPSIDQIQALAEGGATTPDGAGAETSGGGMFGMLSMFGGGGSGGAAGAGMLGMFHGVVEQVFEVSIRKVVLTVKWSVIGRDRELKVVAYVTDPAAMNQVLGGLGAAGASEYTGGGGGGSGGAGGSGGSSGGGSSGGGRGNSAGGGGRR